MKLLVKSLLYIFFAAAAVQAQEPKQIVIQSEQSKLIAEVVASSLPKVIKGAPFSAEAVSESVQVLADGNKLTQTSTTKMYRDGEGRYRREQIPNVSVGAGSIVRLQPMISILDPVEGVQLFLYPETKTARRVTIKPVNVENKTQIVGQAVIQTETFVKKQLNVPNIISSGGAPKEESLGTRTIEGLQAEGTRTTTTIPAGGVGNERAFDIVYERWYSKDLQLIVLSTHSDPRFGTQTYRLTNIKRSEPERTLFLLPADYTISNKAQTIIETKKLN